MYSWGVGEYCILLLHELDPTPYFDTSLLGSVQALLTCISERPGGREQRLVQLQRKLSYNFPFSVWCYKVIQSILLLYVHIKFKMP